jgi:hypothetical protein
MSTRLLRSVLVAVLIITLQVNYALDKPDPAKGGATVMTHPFAIVRVKTNSQAADVMFQGP